MLQGWAENSEVGKETAGVRAQPLCPALTSAWLWSRPWRRGAHPPAAARLAATHGGGRASWQNLSGTQDFLQIQYPLLSLSFSSTQPLFKPRATFTLSYSILPLMGGSLALEPECLLCFVLGRRQNGHSMLTEVRSQRPKPEGITASTPMMQQPQALPLFPRPCGNLPLVREKVQAKCEYKRKK